MNEVTVYWEPPKRMADVIKDDPVFAHWASPGVYLWLHPHCTKKQEYGAKHVAYVGRALGSPNVLTRLREHYVLYLGGRYCVRHEYRDGTDQTFVPNQYQSKEFQDIISNEEKYAQLLREARRFANSYMVAAAFRFEHDFDWSNTEFLKRLERQMIYDFQPRENTQGTKNPPTIEFRINHKNKPWEKALFNQHADQA